MLNEIMGQEGEEKQMKIKGKVVLVKKNSLDFVDLKGSIVDRVDELLGNKVVLQLISSTEHLPENKLKAKIGREAYLEKWITTFSSLTPQDTAFDINFGCEEGFGVPGAFIIKNFHHTEFYLRTLTLENVPGHGSVHFVCNSWIYPAHKYKSDRVFFSNQAYLPCKTPATLEHYRQQELVILRGDGTRQLEEWDRVYDYDIYNDLANPERGEDYVRPILGGSSEYPYPRRGRTGRPRSKTDPNSESRIPFIKFLSVYVPRDERFGHLKTSDLLGFNLKIFSQILLPEITNPFDSVSNEFDSLEDILDMYKGGLKLPHIKSSSHSFHLELLRQLIPVDGEGVFKYPTPQLLQDNQTGWRTDEEFAREMLAGMNPIIIRRVQEFPPRSALDPAIYGDQTSKITHDHIQHQLDGLTIDKAINTNRIFILDHHDTLFPYIGRINETTNKMYASRTLLFLRSDGCLKPLAIELSLPRLDGVQCGSISNVYTPAEDGIESSLWQLAKAHVQVNESAIHELISHWLRTHCVIEPFIIATNRQLSVLHPVYKLLHPHFRDTMNINAIARQILINAGGLAEATLSTDKYSMEMTSVVYRDWVFTDEAVPADLLKRGMAVEDSASPHGVRLVIEDYPYAVDGLEIWSAIKTWVHDYINFYYTSDEHIRNDTELQCWWNEIREKGHKDKKNETWWSKMQTRTDLIDSCTIIIWIASALHAATNYSQYPYGGFMPSRPTMSRRLIPEPGSPEYEELIVNPEKVLLRTINDRFKTLLSVGLMEVLSRHSSDEVYLGQRESGWTKDIAPTEAFEKFAIKLGEIEQRITERNGNVKLKNRTGPVKVSYNSLYPTSEGNGITGKGIPNSVAI